MSKALRYLVIVGVLAAVFYAWVEKIIEKDVRAGYEARIFALEKELEQERRRSILYSNSLLCLIDGFIVGVDNYHLVQISGQLCLNIADSLRAMELENSLVEMERSSE